MVDAYLRRLAAAGAMLALLAGCTGEERAATVEQGAGPEATAEASAPQGPSFTNALADEYRKLVEAEEQKYHDQFAAQKFLSKADAARSGEVVLPEDPNAWNIGGSQGIALAEARSRLMNAMDKNARATVPALAARSQAEYDCWVERTGSGFPERDRLACANAFFNTVGLVEDAVVPIENTRFNETLAREYLAYADFEAQQQKDWIDSRHFGRKGIRAANAQRNDEILPELLGRWNLLATDEVPDYVQARKRLIDALDAGARESMPQSAAIAQTRFDCWVERTSEHNDDRYVEKCRREFFDALARIEGTAPPEDTDPVAQTEHLIFFGFDKSDIRPSEQPKIESAADAARAREARQVTVVGHTDTAGTLEYNMALSLRRADSVRAALILSGVPAGTVEVIARGETETRVRTGDGVPKQENRRAEILLWPMTEDGGSSRIPTN